MEYIGIGSFLAIAALTSACQTPAYAEEPKPDLPLPEAPLPEAKPAQPKQLAIEADTLNAVAQYLQHTAVLYSVKCTENPTHWFCQAQPLLSDLQKKAKPVDNESNCKTDKK